MSSSDLVTLFGLLVAAWSLGFCGGYLFTKFKDAVSDATRTG